jgi:PAS domain S-box-containing protein
MPQIVWSTRPDGFHDFYNDRWYEFTGVPYGSTDGDGWNGLFHPDDQPVAWERWRNSLATGEPYEIEYRLRHHDGGYRWTLGRAVPIRDPEGRIERWFGTCTDIHDRKLAEEQLELIVHELGHRIRNIFAVVGSLLTLSARCNPGSEAYVADARERIESLARAHAYIRPQAGSAGERAASPTLLGLVRALLAPYAMEGEAKDPISVYGVDVPIGPSAATSLALVIHELATNAVKHGGLSRSTGRLAIDVTREDDQVVLRWCETGGPEIAAVPQHRGFGTTLSARALKTPLGASMDKRWEREGLEATIRLPLARLSR